MIVDGVQTTIPIHVTDSTGAAFTASTLTAMIRLRKPSDAEDGYYWGSDGTGFAWRAKGTITAWPTAALVSHGNYEHDLAAAASSGKSGGGRISAYYTDNVATPASETTISGVWWDDVWPMATTASGDPAAPGPPSNATFCVLYTSKQFLSAGSTIGEGSSVAIEPTLGQLPQTTLNAIVGNGRVETTFAADGGFNLEGARLAYYRLSVPDGSILIDFQVPDADSFDVSTLIQVGVP
jgi:hypothetical protein